ncbi:MraY family glycosyltransferase [Brevundimonas sp. 2R-24]|uniref:MraY family glycosyltransferase n=1 Tax=Peiella sedimenti TaxID=3061083 RepID=A0ABT8SI18_9CAUL|nr:MraY family glycosyltransferase [Caulobacteraceae bacterium XZ-24]
MVFAAVLTALVSAALAGVLSVCGPVDAPRARGLHLHPTPTSGGLAVMTATAIGLLTFGLTEPWAPGWHQAALLLACAGALGVYGALDDVIDLGFAAKLGVQLLIAVLFVIFVGRVEALPILPGVELQLGPWIGGAGTVLWLVTIVNVYNFMDGSDGLAPGAQAIALFILALAGAPWPLIAFLLLAGFVANLAFLPLNHPGRRLFQGDAGALFSAFLIGGGAVLITGSPVAVASPYLAVFAAAPLLTDVLLTLLARAKARANLAQAHREHLYQLWLTNTGRSAGALAWRVWGLCGISGLLGYAVDRFAPGWSLLALIVVVAALSAGWFAARRRLAPA